MTGQPEVGHRAVKLTRNAQTAEVGIQTPEKSGCERSPTDNSLRFLPTNGQTGMYGSPIHRQLCMSPKSTSITRAQPQRHDFRCNQHTAVAWKFAHVAYILVASGIGS